MKNCEPLVLGPALAIASLPGLSNLCGEPLVSSSNLYPGPPMPVPAGSPPWIMKLGMTRWQIVPSYSGEQLLLWLVGCVHACLSPCHSVMLFTVLVVSCS